MPTHPVRALARVLPFAFLLVVSITGAACSGGGGGGGAVSEPTGPETAVFVSADRRTLLAARIDGSATRPLAPAAISEINAFAVSPDGNFVAYTADTETFEVFKVFVVDLAGGSPQLLIDTSASDFVVDFQWAPDSQSLCYRIDPAGSNAYQLRRVDRDGTGDYLIHAPQPYEFVAAYAWSPDGTLVAFNTRPRQASGPTQMRMHDARTHAGGSLTLVAAPVGHSVDSFAFSPDGSAVAVVTDAFGTIGEHAVLRSNSDGSGSPLPVGPAASTAALSAKWSPSGNWLAEVTDNTTTHSIGLEVTDAATGLPRRVMATDYVDLALWSPTADRLLIAAPWDPATNAPAPSVHLMVYDPAADVLTELAAAEVAVGDLTFFDQPWSPDGRLLTFTADGRRLLYLLDPDQPTSPHLLTGGSGALVCQSTWSPDSQHLGIARCDTAAPFPGEWTLFDNQGQLQWSSGAFNTDATSLYLRWTTDSARAVFARNASATDGPDLLYSIAADGLDELLVTPTAAINGPVYQLAHRRLAAQ